MLVSFSLIELAFHPVAHSKLQQWYFGWIPESCNRQCLWQATRLSPLPSVHVISVLEIVWVLFHHQVIKQIIYICHYKSLFDQEMDHLSSTETATNTLQNIELSDFHWDHVEPIYQVSSLCQFSWSDLILVKLWHLLSEKCLR